MTLKIPFATLVGYDNGRTEYLRARNSVASPRINHFVLNDLQPYLLAFSS